MDGFRNFPTPVSRCISALSDILGNPTTFRFSLDRIIETHDVVRHSSILICLLLITSQHEFDAMAVRVVAKFQFPISQTVCVTFSVHHKRVSSQHQPPRNFNYRPHLAPLCTDQKASDTCKYR